MSTVAPRLVLVWVLIAAFGCGHSRGGAPSEATTALASSAVPAWELPPPPIAVGPVVPEGRVHRSRLENGLELFLFEDHSLPRIEAGFATRRGIGAEPSARAGITSLLTEVMERGAGERDALALAQAVEALGASLSVGADWDSLGVSVSGLSEDREALFATLRDVVAAPRFSSDEISRAKAEQIAALESAKDDPRELVSRAMARVLYPEHRFGIPASGTAQSVERISATALRKWHARLILPEGAIFWAVGDLDPERFRASAEALFGKLHNSAPPIEAIPAVPETSPAERRIVVIDRQGLAQAQIALANEGIARTDPERIAASLMNSVLGGGGFLSRLMSRVRADEGLTYGVSSGFSLRSQPGPFSIRTFTQVDQVGRVVEILLEEVEAIGAAKPPNVEELEAAKRLSAGRFVLGLETSAAIASSLIDLDINRLPPDSLDTYRGRVTSIALEDAAAQAAKRLHPERMAIVVAGPADVLVPQLESFGAVSVQKPD